MDFRFVLKKSEVMDFMQGTDVVFHAAGVLDQRPPMENENETAAARATKQSNCHRLWRVLVSSL